MNNLLFSTEYFILVIIANIIIAPIAYYLMEDWLNTFATRINIVFSVFLYSGLIGLLLSSLATGFIVIKTVNSNPVDSIRD